MSVKLYNLSRYSDDVLLPVLTSAMRLAVATGDVIVKVTRGGRRVGSHAHRANFVYQWFLSKRQRIKSTGRFRMRMIQTSGGYVVMQPRDIRRYWNERVPDAGSQTGFVLMSRSATDGLASANRFFETAVHEFAHIVQFQTGFGNFATAHNGRRPKWAKRPEEIDAVNRTDDALAKLKRQPDRWARVQEEIVALALEMEPKGS